ncbi:hypothetical protein MMC11_008717 [Xylographa trunciseda]|nr:hypothetical protein [Xylographa trunciseda]
MVWPNRLWEGIASNIVDNAEANYGRSSRAGRSRRQTDSHRASGYDMGEAPPPYDHGPPPPAPSGGGPYLGSDGRMHYPAQPGGGPPSTPPGYRRGESGGFTNMGGLESALPPMSGSRGGPPSSYGGYGGYDRGSPSGPPPDDFGYGGDGGYGAGSPGNPPPHDFGYGGGGGRTGGPSRRPSFGGPPGPPFSGSRVPSGPLGSFENPYPYGQGPSDLGSRSGPPRAPAYGGGGVGGGRATGHGASRYGGSEYGDSGHGNGPIIREIRPRRYEGGGGSYGLDRSRSTRGPSRHDYGEYRDYSPQISSRACGRSPRLSTLPHSTRSSKAPRSPLEEPSKHQTGRRRSDRPFPPVFCMRNPTAAAPLSPSEEAPRRRRYRSPSPPDSPFYETRVPWGSRAPSPSMSACYETRAPKGYRSPFAPYPRSPSSLSGAGTSKAPRYAFASQPLRARFEAWKQAHSHPSSPEPLSPECEIRVPKGYRSPPRHPSPDFSENSRSPSPDSDSSSHSPSPSSDSSAHTVTSPLPAPPSIATLPVLSIRDLLVGRTFCHWPDFRLADIFKRKYPAHKTLHDHATLLAVYLQLEREKGADWLKWTGSEGVEEKKRVHEELHADGERWGDRQVELDRMGWECRRCAEEKGTYRKVLSEEEGKRRREWNKSRGG